MKSALIFITAILLLTGCDQMKRQDLKSPCVSLGTQDGPCERFPINTAWKFKQEESQS